MYETVDHTGDLALRIRSDSFPELVAEGIRGLGSLLFEGAPSVEATETETVRVSGIDPEDLLVQALSEALYWMQSEGRFPLGVGVHMVGPSALEIQLRGVVADGRSCRMAQEIKAVTYHALTILETDRGLETVVVLDV
ncbi:MAG: archease [Myxococcota bacterium]